MTLLEGFAGAAGFVASLVHCLGRELGGGRGAAGNADLADSLSGKPGISVCTGVPIEFFLNKWIKTETETAAIS
jgi:hypothetical protein